jgi:hypothetical protein
MINYDTNREPLSRVLLQKAAAVWIPSKIRAITFLRIEYALLISYSQRLKRSIILGLGSTLSPQYMTRGQKPYNTAVLALRQTKSMSSNFKNCFDALARVRAPALLEWRRFGTDMID